jgi:DNA-binding transcriptional MerR regulator
MKTTKQIDFEWIQLIKEALQLGLTVAEIRAFLKGERNAGCDDWSLWEK